MPFQVSLYKAIIGYENLNCLIAQYINYDEQLC